MAVSLREMTEEMKLLEAMVDGGELDESMIADTMAGLEGMFEEKALRVAHVINQKAADLLVIKTEMDRLAKRAKTLKTGVESLKNYLSMNMEHANLKTITSPEISITLAKGVEVCIIDDVDELPDEWVNTSVVTTPDKKAILAELKRIRDADTAKLAEMAEVEEYEHEREEFPGAHLERNPNSVRIR